MSRWILIVLVICLASSPVRSLQLDKAYQALAGATRGITKTVAEVSPGLRELPKEIDAVKPIVANNAIVKEVLAIKDCIDKAFFNITFSQCANIKKLIGVDYDAYNGEEPDLNNLKLIYSTPDIRIEYKLVTLTQLLRTPNFDPTKRLVIYMHGFTDDPDLVRFTQVNDVFMKQANTYSYINTRYQPFLIEFLFSSLSLTKSGFLSLKISCALFISNKLLLSVKTEESSLNGITVLPPNMTRWVLILTVLCLSSSSYGGLQFDKAIQGIAGVTRGITRTVADVSPGLRDLPKDVDTVKPIVANNGVTKEVLAIKDPIDKTVFNVTFSQCANIKKLVGVNYDAYNGEEPDMNNLKILFITPDIRIEYKLVTLKQLLQTPNFDPAKRLVIYMHGFTDDPDLVSFTQVNDAFMKQGNYNLLALDASSLIRFLYLRSSTMVRFVGETLGTTLAQMIEAGMKPEQIHLVGHSLGSHIASFAGKTVYSLTGQKVGRLSGLDPAGPCFADVESGLKLNSTDAEFVDVIHTDASVYGLNEQVGDIDFYPNGGSEQPNCLLQTCSHNRVWELFAESLSNPQGFPAVRCESWIDFKKGNCNNNDVKYMGLASIPGGSPGKYFLQTAQQAPFALGMGGITFTNTDGIVRNLRDRGNVWK